MANSLINLNCYNCGKQIAVYRAHYIFKLKRRQDKFFCDKNCYLAYHRNQALVNCANCGREFTVRGYRIKSTRKFYCSQKCRKTSKVVGCSYCGKKFKRKPSEIREYNFCSRDCMGKWQSENKRGENSNSWLGGWEKYYGSDWVEQKNLARKRDNFSCQICGKRENGKSFDVHHIVPFRIFGIERSLEANELGNLMTVCGSCHSSIEPRRQYTGKKVELING